MNIRELGDRKWELERDMAIALHRLMSKFKDETGVSPCAIDVQMVDVTRMDSVGREFEVGAVTTEIKL